MKISYADYIKKSPASVLVAEAIFTELEKKYPCFELGDIAESTSGGTPLRGNSEYYNGEIPWLKSGELNDGFIESAEEFITEAGLKNSSAKLFDEGTLLIAMYGATAGRTGIIKIRAATNQSICAVFPKPVIERDYLYWFFRSHRYKFIEKSKGGAQPNLSQSVILKTKVPVPDKERQKELIALLKSIDEEGKIDLSKIPNQFKASVKYVLTTKNGCTEIESELTHQISLVKQLRQAFLREAMQGKLVPQDPKDGHAKDLLAQIKAEKAKLGKKDKPLPPIKPEEIPFEIPEGWVWCRLGEVVLHSEAGKSYKCEEIPISNENEWGVIKVSAVSWDIFLEEQNKLFSKTVPSDISAKVKQGDFLISRANTSELVGKSVVVNTISKNLLLSDKTIRFKFPNFINSDFINL
jgi:type I restriction enzyme S subunit